MSCDDFDCLAATAAAALASGLSYGKYVALFGCAVPKTPEPDASANLVTVCPECGVSFYKTHGAQRYCCRECAYRHGQREARRRYRMRQAAAKAAADGGDDD